MEQQLCQSCAMPLATDADRGTEADGSKSQTYCCYCYESGALTGDPDMTMEQMIEACIAPCLEARVYPDAQTARAQMQAFFPQLLRWKKEA